MATPTPCLSPTPRISLNLISAVPGGPVGLAADIIPSTASENGITLNSDGLYSPGRPQIVSTLPGSPFDGQEIYFIADPTDTSVKWHMRYAAGSSDTYKWQFLGGSPLHAETQGSDTLTGQNDSNYHSVSNGPSVTAPTDGVYNIYMTAHVNPANDAGAGGVVYRVGAQYCGNLPGDNDGMSWVPPTGITTTGQVTLSKTLHNRTCCGGQAVKLVYGNSAGAGTETVAFLRRTIAIVPTKMG